MEIARCKYNFRTVSSGLMPLLLLLIVMVVISAGRVASIEIDNRLVQPQHGEYCQLFVDVN